ncbi:MAG: hypothetical protein IIT46_11395 [Lachnospiraceae bacterium]|nr:hypothetical protein [Lachnospiraceae bacterium]
MAESNQFGNNYGNNSQYGAGYGQANNNNYNDYQPKYQNPNYSQYNIKNSFDETVSVGDWMVTMLVLGLPCVNIIMLLVWAFGNGVKESKRNYCRANLIWVLIIIAFYIILGIVGVSLLPVLENSRV